MNLLGLVAGDYAVLAAYLVVMVLVGMFFSRRQNSSSEFFLAGRSMGWFPIGISVMATRPEAQEGMGAFLARRDPPWA